MRNKTTIICALLSYPMLAIAAGPPAVSRLVLRGCLETPGGEAPFHLDVFYASNGNAAVVVHNGSERIETRPASFTGDRLEFRFEHYGSEVKATSADGGRTFSGTWTKPGRKGKATTLKFTAAPDPGYRFAPLPDAEPGSPGADPVTGRWLVEFSKSDEPAVGLFRRLEDGSIEGTFLTTGGDYRFLGGSFEKGRLRLSAFDGSHAFLFDARMQEDGTLAGDFWSRDTWHETWTARRDDAAALPDGFKMVKATGKADFASLQYFDLNGRQQTLAELFDGAKVCIIEVFGSWCPNCHDASRFLSGLEKKYGPRGLRVVGMAFEYTGSARRDAVVVRKFAERCRAEYPILLAGVPEAESIAKALPFIDGVKAYPTTIILDAAGNVHAVHTGFAGPATGEDHEKLRRAFSAIVERMLNDSAPPTREKE